MIDFFGHRDADVRLADRIGGTEFPSPVGLGWRVDPERRATPGLARFGVGAIEVLVDARCDVRRGERESLVDGMPVPADWPPTSECAGRSLRRRLNTEGGERVEFPSGAALPVVAWDAPPGACATGFSGGGVLQAGTRLPSGGWRVPAALPEDLPHRVSAWRKYLAPGATLVVAGGIAGPGDALALVDSGADIVLIDAGLVFHGPGLVKRCNEALLARSAAVDGPRATAGVFHRAWVWAFALGAALALGGFATLVLAATRYCCPT